MTEMGRMGDDQGAPHSLADGRCSSVVIFFSISVGTRVIRRVNYLAHGAGSGGGGLELGAA